MAKFQIKCHHTEAINYIDKSSGDRKTFYRAWFYDFDRPAFFPVDREFKPGEPITFEVYPYVSQDVKTNGRLSLRYVPEQR